MLLRRRFPAAMHAHMHHYHPLTILPASDPAQILRYRDRQYSAELIAAALLHLDFFSWLHENGGASSEVLVQHFSLAARPLDVLLTLCRASDFLTTDSSDGHHLTTTGREYLVRDSPWYLGPYYSPIRETAIVTGYMQVLRTGRPANWQAKADAADWHASMRDEIFARDFTALMNCRGIVFGQHLARALTPHLGTRRRLLDVGGGSGIYSAAAVAAHPGLTAVVLEQAPVDAITRREIARHGLSDRVQVHTADMFHGSWPEADVILFSNVLHDWDYPEVRQLLQKAAATLAPGGLLVIHDAFVSDDKSGPLPVAEYSALLMNITQGKCYSAAEYGAILRDLGFETGACVPNISDRSFLTAVKQP